MKRMCNVGYLVMVMSVSLAANAPAPGTPAWNLAAEAAQRACLIESKVCDLDLFSVTFTTIEAIIEKEWTISSQVHVLQSAVDNYTFDFDGTFTALQKVLDLACEFDTAIDTSNSLIDITQSSIGSPITNALVGDNGYTISAGGEYYLAENIIFEPGATNLAAITIDADNVNLDFKSKTLSTDGTSGTRGVELVTTHTNIAIFNGAISNTHAQGILLNMHSSDVSIDDMVVKASLDDSGIEFAASCTNIFFNNVAVVGCYEHGIVGNDASSIVLQQCTLSNNGQSSSVGSGMYCSNCSVVALLNCSAGANFDDGYTFTSGITSDSISLNECVALSNTNHGISFTNIEGASIINCYCAQNEQDGIRLVDSQSVSVAYNCCESNGDDNIRLATGTSGTHNCYVGQNSLMLTSSVNLREELGSSDNGILGNYALAVNSANNYVTFGGSFINSSPLMQTSAFDTPEPTFWNNISMTTA